MEFASMAEARRVTHQQKTTISGLREQIKTLAAERDAAVARAERWDTEAAAARITIPRLEAERGAARAEAERLRHGIESAMREIEDAGPKALKYAAQELQAALAAKEGT